MSAFAGFDNGISRRLLQDAGDHAYVAMLTRNGPAVALLYADKDKNKDGVFASLPASTSIHKVGLDAAKALLSAKQKGLENGAMSASGIRVGVHDGMEVHAKSGRFGNYLEWTDSGTNIKQTVAFPGTNVSPENVTIEQAQEWIRKTKLLLRKVNATFSIKYNPEWDSVFISKRPASGRGRPAFSAMEGFTKEDIEKINKLTVSEVEILFHAGQESKRLKRGKPTQRKVSSTQPFGTTTKSIPPRKRSSSHKRPSMKMSQKKKAS